jgi:hypothetical protein
MPAETEGPLHADDLVNDRTNLRTLRSLESISFVSHGYLFRGGYPMRRFASTSLLWRRFRSALLRNAALTHFLKALLARLVRFFDVRFFIVLVAPLYAFL